MTTQRKEGAASAAPVSRRSVLVASAVAVAAVGITAATAPAAATAPDAELLALDAERQAANAACNRPGISDAEVDVIATQINELEKRMIAAPAATIRGALLKAAIYTEATFPPNDDEHDHCTLALLAAIADLERIAAKGGAL